MLLRSLCINNIQGTFVASQTVEDTVERVLHTLLLPEGCIYRLLLHVMHLIRFAPSLVSLAALPGCLVGVHPVVAFVGCLSPALSYLAQSQPRTIM